MRGAGCRAARLAAGRPGAGQAAGPQNAQRAGYSCGRRRSLAIDNPVSQDPHARGATPAAVGDSGVVAEDQAGTGTGAPGREGPAAPAPEGPRPPGTGEQRPSGASWRQQRVTTRAAGLVARNRLFCLVLGLAVVPRVIVAAGFQPAIMVRLDSFIYLMDATRATPDPDNTDGYPFLLWLLKPFHSLALIAGLQHVMGLVAGVLVYAIMRRRGIHRWVATLVALPVLFDSRELLIEQAIMSDTLATLLMIAAFAVLLWDRAPSIRQTAAAGVLMGLSAVVRPTVLPLIVLAAGYVLVARLGWRRAGAALAGGLLPVAGYAAWFYSAYGVFNLTNSSGLFLWSRTMSFANCAVVKPPPDLQPLCPSRNRGTPGKLPPNPRSWHTLLRQETPQDYLWDRSSWMWQPWTSKAYEPYQVAFTPAKNKRAQKFAVRAILAQPAGYATVVGEGVALTFLTTDHNWQFPYRQLRSPSTPNGTYLYELRALRAYAGSTAGLARYLGFYTGTRLQQPYAHLLSPYQKLAYLPGVVLALVFAAGLAGILIWRKGSAAALLLWLSAVTQLVLPIAVHQFNYRYTLAAVPLACMAAALAIAGGPRAAAATAAEPGDRQRS